MIGYEWFPRKIKLYSRGICMGKSTSQRLGRVSCVRRTEFRSLISASLSLNMTTLPGSITTNSTPSTSSVSNDHFSSGSQNLMVLSNPTMYCIPIQPSPYSANYIYPSNCFYNVPLWIQPLSNNDQRQDDNLVANGLAQNNMTQNTNQSLLLKSLCSTLSKFPTSNSSKSDDVLIQDCIDGLTEYSKNFNFQFSKEQRYSSRKRRRTFGDGCSSDSEYTDVDSDAEVTQPNELVVLEKCLHKIKKEYEKPITTTTTMEQSKPFLPSVNTEQNSTFDKSLVPHENTPQSSPKYERKNNNPPIGIQVETDENGNTIYKARGKPIKFKVVKNRPKNGLFNKTWEWHFDKLKDFLNRYGHTNVTRSVEGYEDIGTWVAEQRRKIKKGRITFEQFQKLNDVGFEWDRSYYFYNTLHNNKKPKSSSDEEVASFPSNSEEGFGIDRPSPKDEVAQHVPAMEPVL